MGLGGSTRVSRALRMLTLVTSAAASAFLAAGAAYAQTTNCQWIGSTWSCAQQPGINWGALQPGPNPGAAFAAGVAQRQAYEAQRQALEAQRVQAQAMAQGPARWSKEGATQESYMQDRFSCMKDAVLPTGDLSAGLFVACMGARGYVRDDNGFGPPAGAAVIGH